jgi:hypothetical protein
LTGVPEALEAAERLPQGVGPRPVQVRPADVSDQSTPPLFGSLITVGVNGVWVALPAVAFADIGETVTAIGGVTVIVAEEVLLESVIDVALSVTVKIEAAAGGAVYMTGVPEALIAAERLPQFVVPVQARP